MASLPPNRFGAQWGYFQKLQLDQPHLQPRLQRPNATFNPTFCFFFPLIGSCKGTKVQMQHEKQLTRLGMHIPEARLQFQLPGCTRHMCC